MASSSPSKTWSETRSGRTIVLGGLLGLFVLVFWLAQKSRHMVTRPTAAPALVVEERHLSFGEASEDPAFIVTLPIHNTTNEDIGIDGFAANCPCGKVEPSSLTIPAQETREVRLTLDLRSSPTGKPDVAGRDFKVYIQPRISKGTGSQKGWVVHGRVMRPFVIDPPVVDFEESLVREQPFAPRSAVITCGMDMAELSAFCDSPFLTAKIIRDTKTPRRYRLEVQARKDIPGGPFNHLVRFAALPPNKEKVSGAVSVVGRVQEEVYIQPEFLASGAEPIGTKIQETVTLQSRNGKNFKIQEIDKSGASGVTIGMERKHKDGRQTLIVSFLAERLGHQEHTIHIKVKVPEGMLDLPLRMNYYGIPVHAVGKK